MQTNIRSQLKIQDPWTILFTNQSANRNQQITHDSIKNLERSTFRTSVLKELFCHPHLGWADKQFQTGTILDEKKYLDLLHLDMDTYVFKIYLFLNILI